MVWVRSIARSGGTPAFAFGPGHLGSNAGAGREKGSAVDAHSMSGTARGGGVQSRQPHQTRSHVTAMRQNVQVTLQ